MMVLVNGAVLAIDGIPVDMGTDPVLLPPTVSITTIAQATPVSPLTISVLISGRDAAATAIILHFFVLSASRGTQSAIVANANGTATPVFAAGLVVDGETLWVRATSAAGLVRSNLSAPASFAYVADYSSSNAIPASVPFAI
jgi:hypothetical protein